MNTSCFSLALILVIYCTHYKTGDGVSIDFYAEPRVIFGYKKSFLCKTNGISAG